MQNSNLQHEEDKTEMHPSVLQAGAAIVVCLLIAANLVAGLAETGFPVVYIDDHGFNYTTEEKVDDDCFRAAVLEYNAFFQTVNEVVALYNAVAVEAARRGAKLLVFPEGGIGFPQSDIDQPLIPDPERLTDNENNLCLLSEQRNTTEPGLVLLTRLSCIARQTKLYLVVNLAASQECKESSTTGQSECLSSGRLWLNTNVVLDPEGRFIKRYRKYNLVARDLDSFSHPPSLDEVYFDTPYGRFGVLNGYDIFFKSPAVNLIEKHHIDHALFPTYWQDEAPIFSTAQLLNGWSRLNQVNLLAANLLRPEEGSVGSGMYGNFSLLTTGKPVPPVTTTRLVIANLPRDPKSSACVGKFDGVYVSLTSGYLRPSGHPELPTKQYKYEYKNYRLLDSDTIAVHLKPKTKVQLCNGKVCCTIKFTVKQPVSNEALSKLIIVVRDGNRDDPSGINLYEQVCLLATLKKPLDRSKLNETVFAELSPLEFEHIHMEATFGSSYVIPLIGSALIQPVARGEHRFKCSERLKIGDGLFRCRQFYYPFQESLETKLPRKIYSFALYGRMFERDRMPSGWNATKPVLPNAEASSSRTDL